MMKKILYIIVDGLGDQPLETLGQKTPLEAAFTPMLDLLAQKGKTGIVYPAGKGIVSESGIALMGLLGYDARMLSTGRGPLEAFAEGIIFNEGDLAVRANFASVGEDGTIKDRFLGDLSTQEITGLTQEINTQLILSSAAFELKYTAGHGGALVIRSLRSRLSGEISNTDPAYARQGVPGVAEGEFEPRVLASEPLEESRDNAHAAEAARLLNEFTEKSHAILENSPINKVRMSIGKAPANMLLCRDAGDRLPVFTAIADCFNGLQCGALVEMPVERGIALLCGMEIVKVPPSGQRPEADYERWVDLVVQSSNYFDCLYIHLKGPDACGHKRDGAAKKTSIETIDKHFFKPLFSKIAVDDYIIAVTGDHVVSSESGSRTADPVPLVISGPGISADGSMSFSEKTARAGSLGEIMGIDLLKMIVGFARQPL